VRACGGSGWVAPELFPELTHEPREVKAAAAALAKPPAHTSPKTTDGEAHDAPPAAPPVGPSDVGGAAQVPLNDALPRSATLITAAAVMAAAGVAALMVRSTQG
jgi:hypothetical protein